MNSREQTLAVLLVGLIVAAVAAAGGYFFVLRPLNKQRDAENALNSEIRDLETQLDAQKSVSKKLSQARVRGLPADEAMAKREYTVALARMAELSGAPKGFRITPKSVDNSARAVPQLAKDKPVYTRVAFELEFKKANMTAVKEFLQRYYQYGLMHQITALSIKKDDDPNVKKADNRNDLTVLITTEAILIEGAENRKTLTPIPTAFAAVGGGGLYLHMGRTAETGRAVVPPPAAPVLSPVARDYDLVVLKDPFNGPLPPDKPPPQPSPFKLGKISDVKVDPEKKPNPVRVSMTGKGSNGAKFTAIASGELYAEGELMVDPKEYTIELPATEATTGTATITVIATSADGTDTDKTTFKVTVREEEKKPEAKIKEDVSSAIILTGTVPRSDGTAWARIFDNANRLRYTLDADAKGVTVLKEYKKAATLPWRKDVDHDHPKGVLVISDDESRTNRTFKVIAIDIDGLIVADLKPDGAGAPGKAPGKGPGGWPPKGGAAPKQGPANPLAALGGNMIVAAKKPVLYRWAVGQSLAGLTAIPESEAKKIMQAASTSGPVFDVAATIK
ncbi:MAG: hypothetical protein FJ304_07905 [Planctomycetes bacterium]|nr:hypothetical protein [Planctomycetota bacterium]